MNAKRREKIFSYAPEMILISILMLVMYLASFVSYDYNGETYQISGYQFLRGLNIFEGRIAIEPQLLMMVTPVIALLLLLASIALHNKKKIFGAVCSIAGLAVIVINLIIRSRIGKIVDEAVTLRAGNAVPILALFGILVTVEGLVTLYRAKSVVSYDLMALPGFVYIIINCYIPMFGIILAFKEVNYTKGIFNGAWVGFQNFKYLFADLPMLLKNTLAYNIVFIIVGNVTAILVAACLSEVFSSKLKKLYQTSILLPNLISIVIIAYIVYAFLSTDSGWINNHLLKGREVNFYVTKKYWPYILVFVNVWKSVGYDAIIYLSSILGIDRGIYEAAKVDGCGRVRQFFTITLPLLKPTIVTLLLLAMGRIISSDFGLFYQIPMNSGPLIPVTQTIDTYVYRALTTTNNIGRATAAGAFQSIVGFVLVMASNWAVRRADKDLSLF